MSWFGHFFGDKLSTTEKSSAVSIETPQFKSLLALRLSLIDVMSEFDKYIRQGEPNQAEKARIWGRKYKNNGRLHYQVPAQLWL